MPSRSWKALGGPLVLGHLRPDLRAAKSVLLIGPWIDEYVAQEILDAAPKSAQFRVLSRPYDAMEPGFTPHARAAHQAFIGVGNAEVRVLRTLHAKLIIVDDDITYSGSANWYRYSLEQSQEIVLRGPTSEAAGMLDLAEQLWQSGTCMGAPATPKPRAREPAPVGAGYNVELVDPIAAAVLKDVPGSFVIKPKKRFR